MIEFNRIAAMRAFRTVSSVTPRARTVAAFALTAVSGVLLMKSLPLAHEDRAERIRPQPGEDAR
ncbi:MAG: hypothetical protein AB7F51_14860 [Pseudorhodoplanes sp.]